jgi:hypothetical protein
LSRGRLLIRYEGRIDHAVGHTVDSVMGWGPHRSSRGFRTALGIGNGWGKITAGIVGGLAVAAAATACGSASGQTGSLPVPTFAAAAATPTAESDVLPTDQGQLPDDCTRLLGENDLGALYGLPLDSVVVRTTIGVAAPSVGRTERLGCRYTRVVGPRVDLLDVNVSAYVDAEAAAKQWRTNAGAEDGAHHEMQLGGARALLVERPSEAVLMIAHNAQTLTFVLPEQIRVRNLTAADTLTDLALRVLPTVSGEPGPSTGT